MRLYEIRRMMCLKILTFDPRDPYSKVLNELKSKIEKVDATEPWHCFHPICGLVVSEKLYGKYNEHFNHYKPHVEDDITIRIHVKEAQNDIIPWGVQFLGGDRLWQRGKGTGVKVAILDTGIDRSHRDLKNRIKGGVHFVRGKMSGHGTHVAGITAAAINHYGIIGVAPEADLYDVRAFSSEGKATLANIMKGIDWSIQNNMQIINMSFGMPEYSKALHLMVKKASEKGITMVASAGNNGGSVDYPARYANVIGVGAVNQKGKLADFSSRGVGMNRTAPGVDIYSTWPRNGFRTLDGTSMAAPHITGLMALRLGTQK
jgi:subtilisin